MPSVQCKRRCCISGATRVIAYTVEVTLKSWQQLECTVSLAIQWRAVGSCSDYT
jgi:hypothetical protein